MGVHSLSGGTAYNGTDLPSGTLIVSLASNNGEEFVYTDLDGVASGFELTADEARAYAADLVAHADALDERRIPRTGDSA